MVPTVIFIGKETLLIHSLYATKYTRDVLAGKKNPERDMTNRKALEKPQRKADWLARQKAKANGK